MKQPTLRWERAVSTLIFLGLLVWAVSGLGVSSQRILAGLPKGAGYFTAMFAHPDASYLPEIGTGLRESLQIAFVGTAIAAVLAVPFGVFAARSLSRLPALPYAGKLLLNLIRTFPELILAIAFIKGLGPGAFAGVLAIAIHSIGMMGKLYAERIETTDRGTQEALQAVGAGPLAIFWYAVLPEVLPDFLSFALYRFDLNVRSASVLGLVGAGGIGTALELERNSGNWPAIGMILVGIMLTVGAVDLLSARLRARLV